MYLWRIERTDDVQHDETESVIVAATTEVGARMEAMAARGDQPSGVWLTATAEHIGDARYGMPRGIVMESYKAG